MISQNHQQYVTAEGNNIPFNDKRLFYRQKDEKLRHVLYTQDLLVPVYHKSLPLIVNQQGESITSPENLFHQIPINREWVSDDAENL